MTALMSPTEGFTRATSPTNTVGTVSFPPATERTRAAASGSVQMLWRRLGMRASFRPKRRATQYGQPGRQ